MKKSTQLLKSAFILNFVVSTCTFFLCLTFTGCKKETGPKGDTGPAGAPGNANVYTYTFTAALSSFIGPLTGGEYSQSINPFTFMSQTITNKDAVLLYKYNQTVSSTEYYDAMPFVDYYNTSSYNNHYFEIGSTGSGNIFILKIRNSNNVAPYSPMSGNLKYKVVLIKGTNKISLPADQSYQNIKKIYNLD